MNILFAFAHMDDESFGPAGTIAKLANDGHNVTVLSLCRGRGGDGLADQRRKSIFYNVCKNTLGVEGLVYPVVDLHLTPNEAKERLSVAMKSVEPDAVYTHNINDLHSDHRALAEAALIVCRPTPVSKVKELYMCEHAPSSSWTFGQMGDTFTPNVYVEVAGRWLQKKVEALEQYKDELRPAPDARSVKAMTDLAHYRGFQVGVDSAEGFKQVYRIR